MLQPTQTSPWWQEKATQLFTNKYVLAEDRKEYMVENIKVIALFFGSYRNRPTKHFVKYLNKLYSYTTEQRARLEIIFVPQDEEEIESEFFIKALMGDWLVVPWSNQQLRRRVKNMYAVTEQPSLVVVKNDARGSLIKLDGKSDVLDYGYFCWKEWIDLAKELAPPGQQQESTLPAQNLQGLVISDSVPGENPDSGTPGVKSDSGQPGQLDSSTPGEKRDSVTGEKRDSVTGEKRDSVTGEKRDSVTGEKRDSVTGEKRDSATGEKKSDSDEKGDKSDSAEKGDKSDSTALGEKADAAAPGDKSDSAAPGHKPHSTKTDETPHHPIADIPASEIYLLKTAGTYT